MNRKCKYCNKYYLKNYYNCDKLSNMNCKIFNIYYQLYQTGCALDDISKACNIGKIVCGIRNLM